MIEPDLWSSELRRSVQHARDQSGARVEVLVASPVPAASPQIAMLCRSLAATTGVRIVDTPGRTRAQRRNDAAARAGGDVLVFLGEGDLLQPDFGIAVAGALEDPAVGFAVSGARLEPGGAAVGGALPNPAAPGAWADAVWREPIAVGWRRRVFDAAGGFDAGLEALEVWDLLLRASAAGARGRGVWPERLVTVAAADRRHRLELDSPAERGAVRVILERHHAAFARPDALLAREVRRRALVAARGERLKRRRRAEIDLESHRTEIARHRLRLESHGAAGVEWGDLRRVTPVSRNWGFERGTPVDRYYIERFLASHAADIRGAVLEIQDGEYTARFGNGRVERGDVLDVHAANPHATVVDDLRQAVTLTEETYDCLIVTQTLHVIDDVRAALATCFRVLKPGGVLLATLPAVSRLATEYGPRGDFWRVTPAGARELFEEIFPAGELDVRPFGNVLSGTAFLHGFALQEFRPDELDRADPMLPVLVGVRARKPSRGAPAVRRAGSATGAILMYHRVGEAAPDPHGLVMPAARFDGHMQTLARRWTPLPLEVFVEAWHRRQLPDRAVAVTLDDGYRDAGLVAAPILSRWGIPATLFVPSRILDDPAEFWWDVLARVWLTDLALPPAFPRPGGRGPSDRLPADSPAARRAAHDLLHALLLRAAVHVRDDIVAALVAWCGLEPAPDGQGRPMSAGDLATWAGRPGLSVGAHGVHHVLLPEQTLPAQLAEIQESRRRLEQALGGPVRTLAYPYGAPDARSACLAEACGYACAVTGDDRAVRPDDSCWRLPRVDPRAVPADGLDAWLTRVVEGASAAPGASR